MACPLVLMTALYPSWAAVVREKILLIKFQCPQRNSLNCSMMMSVDHYCYYYYYHYRKLLLCLCFNKLQSTPFKANTVGTQSQCLPQRECLRTGDCSFGLNIGNLFLPGIQLLSVLLECSLQWGVREVRVGGKEKKLLLMPINRPSLICKELSMNIILDFAQSHRIPSLKSTRTEQCKVLDQHLSSASSEVYCLRINTWQDFRTATQFVIRLFHING